MASIEVVRTKLDELTVLYAPGGGHLPSAGLTFRAGRADETAATSGLSHLLEHLILPARTGEAVDFNGYVDALVTAVFASGPADQLRAFLRSTAALVGELPRERLEVERRILLAEEAARATGGARQAIALRFGPMGSGLGGYYEYGLRRLELDAVEAWAATRFTQRNAVLWLAGLPPDEMEVRLLTGTERFACPEPRQIDDLRTPAVYAAAPGSGITLSFLSPRPSYTGVMLELLTDALLDRLRYDLGLSYSIESDSQALSAEVAHVVVTADVADDSVPEWLDEAVAIIDELASSGPDEARLERLKESRRRYDEDPASVSGWVAACADWELHGLPFQSHAEFAAERDALSPDDVAGLVATMRPSLLVVGPETAPTPAGFEPYPYTSSRRVSGRRHRPSAVRDRFRRNLRLAELRSSSEGVTAISPSGDAATALYDTTVLCLREPGERTLLTADGFFVTIAAESWTGGRQLLEEIDAAVPPELVVSDSPTAAVVAAAEIEVARHAKATFKRTWLVSDELEALPSMLEKDESIVLLARASRGWRLGLLALTDRRLRFVYGDGTSHSFSVDRGTSVHPRTDGTTLELDVDGERIRLTDVDPGGRAEELEGFLGRWPHERAGSVS